MNKSFQKTILFLLAAAAVFSLAGCGKRKLNSATEAWLYDESTPAPPAAVSPTLESVVWTPAPTFLPTPSPVPTFSPTPMPTFSPTPMPTPSLQDFSATTSRQGWVNGDDVNFRKLPGTGSDVITSYDKGKELTILGTQNGWTKVLIDGVSGYIKAEYVTDLWREEFSEQVSVYTDTLVLPGTGTTNLNAIQSRIIQLTNDQRAQNGLPALSYDSRLQNAADIRASELASLFSHTRPDGSDWSTAFPANTFYFVGENLATCDSIISDDSFSSSCVKWWMESEDHRANILNSYYTSIAVGVAVSNGNMYAVQEFGTPY